MAVRIRAHVTHLQDLTNTGRSRIISLANELLRSLSYKRYQEYISEYTVFTTNIFFNHMEAVGQAVALLREAVPDDADYVYCLAEVEDVERLRKLHGLERLHALVGSLLQDAIRTIKASSDKKVFMAKEYVYYIVMRNLLVVNKELMNYRRHFTRVKHTSFFRNLTDHDGSRIEKYKCLLIRGYFMKNFLEFLGSL